MNNGTCIILVLFYIFRHYKRVGDTYKRNELISDLKKCHLILSRMGKNIDPNISTGSVSALIDRVNSWGANIKLQQPLRYADDYDPEIVMIMRRITGEIIDLAKSPFYKKNSSKIFMRFLVLHNLPRSLLNDSSGDMSTGQNFHISKQEALELVSRGLDEEKEQLVQNHKHI